MKQGHPRFYELLEEIAKLHDKKNSNYAIDGDPLSNLKASEAFGIPAWQGTLVRMSDKWARLIELAKGKPDLVGESYVDTLKDLAVYCLLDIVLWEEASD